MALLKGSELEERLSWFEEWTSKKEENIEIVRSLVSGLDFSPESLNLLETFLLNKYDHPMEVYSVDQSEILNSVCLYIGEVYRRNISLNIDWDVNIDTSDENQGMYNFLCYLKSYKEFLGFNPFSKIPFALNKRTGDKLYSHLMHNISLFKKEDAVEEKKKKIPEFKGCQYNHFLFIEKDQLSLKELNLKLFDYYNQKDRKVNFELIGESHLVITLDDVYNFHFSAEKGGDIQTEARELKVSEKIDTRIEFWGDEDIEGAYFNEHLFILEQIESKKIKVYNILQGCFV